MLRGIFLRRKDKAGLPLITNGLGLFTLCRTLFLIAKASYNIFSFCGASSGKFYEASVASHSCAVGTALS